MHWLDDQPGELVKHWLRHTSTPMLATLLDGTILWANRSFEEMIGYSSVELYGKHEPNTIKWTDLTVDHGDLHYDQVMAKSVIDGEIQDYQITKQYKTKTGSLVDVIIHVTRYPSAGSFQCFLVSIYALKVDVQQTYEELREVRAILFDLCAIMDKANINQSLGTAVYNFLSSNPKVAYLIGGVLSVLLFGSRVIEIIQEIKSLFGF